MLHNVANNDQNEGMVHTTFLNQKLSLSLAQIKMKVQHYEIKKLSLSHTDQN